MLSEHSIYIDGQQFIGLPTSTGDSFHIYENVSKDFSDMPYLVCYNYCSKETLCGAFNSIDDAAVYCFLKNIEKWR